MRWVVALSVVLVVLGAALLVRVLGEEVPEPQPQPPEAAPLPVAAVLPPAQLPVVAAVSKPDASMELTADAGRTIDVLFHVKEGRARAVGQRLELQKAGEKVDGLIDVMGHVTLPLEPGVWTIGRPSRTFPAEVEVRDGMSEFEVSVLDPRTVEVVGTVLDGIELRGVPGATVSVSDGTFGYQLTTDYLGGFRATLPGASSLTLFASHGTRRSQNVTVTIPKDSATLALEETTTVLVTVVGPGAEFACVRVRDRSGTQSCQGTPHTFRVLGGPVVASASASFDGQFYFANKAFEVDPAKSVREVVLQLRPAPDLRGTLFGPGGVVLPGVSLEVRAFSLETHRPPATGDERPRPAPRILAATITRADGSFELPWPGAEFVTIRVGPLYALDRDAIVSPGSAPLLLSAHPVGADAQ